MYKFIIFKTPSREFLDLIIMATFSGKQDKYCYFYFIDKYIHLLLRETMLLILSSMVRVGMTHFPVSGVGLDQEKSMNIANPRVPNFFGTRD